MDFSLTILLAAFAGGRQVSGPEPKATRGWTIDPQSRTRRQGSSPDQKTGRQSALWRL